MKYRLPALRTGIWKAPFVEEASPQSIKNGSLSVTQVLSLTVSLVDEHIMPCDDVMVIALVSTTLYSEMIQSTTSSLATVLPLLDSGTVQGIVPRKTAASRQLLLTCSKTDN